MTSLVSSFAYFTHFSNLDISKTNANIWKRLTVFLFFHEILCDTLKNQSKNLIIVPLLMSKFSAQW